MTKRALLVFALALLSSGMPSTHARALPEWRCGGATTVLRTFHVEIDWHKKVYPRGGTVKVSVTVSRPAEEDPLNNGIPLPVPERAPAEGVNITAALLINPPHYPWDAAITDAEGKADLSIPLPKSFTGPVDTSVRAWLWHNENGPACTDVMEETIVNAPRSFTVR
jgi:hypothetical protein